MIQRWEANVPKNLKASSNNSDPAPLPSTALDRENNPYEE